MKWCLINLLEFNFTSFSRFVLKKVKIISIQKYKALKEVSVDNRCPFTPLLFLYRHDVGIIQIHDIRCLKIETKINKRKKQEISIKVQCLFTLLVGIYTDTVENTDKCRPSFPNQSKNLLLVLGPQSIRGYFVMI